MSKERIQKAQKFLKQENLDGFIVNRPISVRYLSGFTGSTAVLIIRSNDAYFLTDFRYKDQSRAQVKGAKIIITKTEVINELKDLPQFHGKNLRYGFETEYLTFFNKERLQNNLKGALLIPIRDFIEQFAIIKDPNEVEMIEKAAAITDKAFERILGYIRPGLRENEVRAELEYQMMVMGSEQPAFETIIASGHRSALPHGVATTKKIAKGDFVTFDFGAQVGGYVADFTRTIVIGKATERQKKIYNIVLKAQEAAIRKVKPGVEGKVLDKTARDIIEKAGYGKYFGHGLGHGIGIYVHSKPSLGKMSPDIMKKGMVFTVEPGIYLPGWGGVRIEDDVLVTANGGRVLNHSPKKLLVV
jgi:Xaa-Pro aminopeptidase